MNSVETPLGWVINGGPQSPSQSVTYALAPAVVVQPKITAYSQIQCCYSENKNHHHDNTITVHNLKRERRKQSYEIIKLVQTQCYKELPFFEIKTMIYNWIYITGKQRAVISSNYIESSLSMEENESLSLIRFSAMFTVSEI